MLYQKITDKIINNLIVNAKLDLDYRDIYAYSLEKYISNLVTVIIFSIVAIVFHVMGETIVFVFFYGPLRKYAGGIHVNSRSLCMLLSLFIMLSVIWLSDLLALSPKWGLASCFLLGLAILLIFILAPVDSPNRRLSPQTKQRYKNRSRGIVIVESAILLVGILCLDALRNYIILGILAILLEGLFLIQFREDNFTKRN
ncbi:MAG: hypothetical protein K0R46_3318 [Herbinix sp.]|jgi:accessory gene regulator B|nr:hypothetical protein [Herbinix sp.]